MVILGNQKFLCDWAGEGRKIVFKNSDMQISTYEKKKYTK